MRIYLASSAWRAVDAEHMQSVQRLMATPRDSGVFIRSQPVVGDALIERSRAIAATRFILDTDCEVLLTIDSDIVFAPEDALEVCRLAMEHDVVCGAYVTRAAERCFPACAFWPDQPVEFIRGQHKAVPIRWAASGFLAVHRRVFEKLAEGLPLCHPDHPLGHRFYPFFTPEPYILPETGECIYLSEDYAFCERARDAGFTINVDPGTYLLHLGTYAFELADMWRPEKERGKPVRVTRTEDGHHAVEIYTPPAQPTVELVAPDGAPLTRQQRRHIERKEAKRAPALAG